MGGPSAFRVHRALADTGLARAAVRAKLTFGFTVKPTNRFPPPLTTPSDDSLASA